MNIMKRAEELWVEVEYWWNNLSAAKKEIMRWSFACGGCFFAGLSIGFWMFQ